MLTRQHPFAEYKFMSDIELEDAVKRGERPRIPADCPAEFRELVADCWHQTPDQRPTFEVPSLPPPPRLGYPLWRC
jgi:hypothetical protein